MSRITAAELMAKLNADPQFVTERERREREFAERSKELREAEAPIVADLRSAGLSVESVWDLVNTSAPYPTAIPVLASHLRHSDYPDAIREGIARALAVKEGKVAWEALLDEYKRAPSSRFKDGLAAALSAIAMVDESLVGIVFELLESPVHGPSRVFFVEPIARLGTEAMRDALSSHLADPQVAPEIRTIQKKMGRW